jgi:hypothetical protein
MSGHKITLSKEKDHATADIGMKVYACRLTKSCLFQERQSWPFCGIGVLNEGLQISPNQRQILIVKSSKRAVVVCSRQSIEGLGSLHYKGNTRRSCLLDSSHNKTPAMSTPGTI